MLKVTVIIRVFLFSSLLLLMYCTNYRSREVKSTREILEIPDSIPDSVFNDADNFFSKEKAELGRYLFYDKRLSVNNTKSCASCHAPQFSFTDSYRRSVGVFGDFTKHNSPLLINIIFNNYFTYTDTSLHSPERQIKNPMFGTVPVEMGWEGNEDEILGRIKQETQYIQLFSKAFAADREKFTVKNVQYAITSFVKTLISLHSPYDQYMKGDSTALSVAAKRGKVLFESKELKCSLCHGGINFNRPVFQQSPYFAAGFSGDAGKDSLRYKVPTLRNLAFTSPYFNDGSVEMLEEVINLFAAGGKAPNRHPYVSGFSLNLEQRKDLVLFLLSLSDSSFIKKTQFQDPWVTK